MRGDSAMHNKFKKNEKYYLPDLWQFSYFNQFF